MSERFFPKAYAALLSYLALAPLYLLPATVLLPDKLWIALVLPIPALVLTGLAGLCRARRRAAALAAAMVLMAAGCFVFFLHIKPLGMLLYLPCAFTMLTFMPAMARPAHQEWTIKHMAFGLVLHIVAQIIKSAAALQAVAAPLSWIFVLYLIAYLFSYNRFMIADTGPATAKPLLRQNRKLLAGFCGLALLLANIRAIGGAVRTAIVWVIQAVANAIVWLFSFMQPTTEEAAESAGDMGSMFGVEEAAEPSLFSRIVEIVLIVLAVLVSLVVLYFFVRYIAKHIRRLLEAIRERLRLYRQRIAAEYDDQSETLLDWGEMRKAAAERFHRAKQRFLPTRWEKLSPAQTVRRVYQLLLRRAEIPDPSRTAREMLLSGALPLPNDASAPAASLYDHARYSTHPISREEADELRKQAGI